VLVRLLTLVVVVAALAGGAWAVKNDVGGIRHKATEQVTALLDSVLGVKKPADKPKPAPRVALARPARTDEKPAATPVAPAPYVDRSPTPSALERVKPDDRKRLEDLIAQKSQAARPVAARDAGAKRHAQ
jgi:uncharacterized membrane protein